MASTMDSYKLNVSCPFPSNGQTQGTCGCDYLHVQNATPAVSSSTNCTCTFNAQKISDLQIPAQNKTNCTENFIFTKNCTATAFSNCTNSTTNCTTQNYDYSMFEEMFQIVPNSTLCTNNSDSLVIHNSTKTETATITTKVSITNGNTTTNTSTSQLITRTTITGPANCTNVTDTVVTLTTPKPSTQTTQTTASSLPTSQTATSTSSPNKQSPSSSPRVTTTRHASKHTGSTSPASIKSTASPKNDTSTTTQSPSTGTTKRPNNSSPPVSSSAVPKQSSSTFTPKSAETVITSANYSPTTHTKISSVTKTVSEAGSAQLGVNASSVSTNGTNATQMGNPTSNGTTVDAITTKTDYTSYSITLLNTSNTTEGLYNNQTNNSALVPVLVGAHAGALFSDDSQLFHLYYIVPVVLLMGILCLTMALIKRRKKQKRSLQAMPGKPQRKRTVRMTLSGSMKGRSGMNYEPMYGSEDNEISQAIMNS